MGDVPSLVINDADMIKQITVKEFSKFTDRGVSKVLSFIVCGFITVTILCTII